MCLGAKYLSKHMCVFVCMRGPVSELNQKFIYYDKYQVIYLMKKTFTLKDIRNKLINAAGCYMENCYTNDA